jgi:hypothetical protein
VQEKNSTISTDAKLQDKVIAGAGATPGRSVWADGGVSVESCPISTTQNE